MNISPFNPLLDGFNTGLAGSASKKAKRAAKAAKAAAKAAPPPPAAAKAAPPALSPAQAHRAKAQAFQASRAEIPESFAQEAVLSAEARAAAQDRFTQAAAEYAATWGAAGGPVITDEDSANMNATAKARAAFITWLRNTNPEAYASAMRQATSPQTLGATDPATASTGFDWKKFVEAATAATTAVFQTRAQKDMLKINIERAKAGLPPMDTSFAAPVIRTQFDVTPEIAQSLQQSAQAGMMNIALFGGAALVAFMLLRR